MTFPLLFLFFLICILMAIDGLAKKGKRIFEPLLPMATVFIGFVGLQLIGLANLPRGLPRGALDKTIIMAIFCVSALWWGYSRRVKPLALMNGVFTSDRLVKVSLGLTVFGAFFFFLISRMSEEVRSSSQWTGLPVAYLFFAEVLSYGFALACLVYCRIGDRRALWIAGLGAIFYLDRIILSGRRAVTAEFFFIVVLALFFGRGRILPSNMPRWFMVAVMVVMILLMHSTGEYRSLAKTQGWEAPLEAVASIAFINNLKSVIESGGVELTNAVFMIEAYDRTFDFDFGIIHWNQMVFNYIPAQLVGRDVKESLAVTLPNVAGEVFGYIPMTGSTLTGLVDSFGSFWYFGCIKFFIVGLLLRKIWNAAQAGGLVAQLLYMLLLVKAMHVVTHGTHIFLSPFVHMAVFLYPGIWWARTKKNRRDVHHLSQQKWCSQ